MTTTATPSPAARKKLLSRIAAVTKLADTAKKAAKLAKAGYKAAKKNFKDAKRAARKHRKEIKTLKAELAALAAQKKPARKSSAKPAMRRKRSLPPPVPALPPEAAPPMTEVATAPESRPAAQ